MWGIRQILDEMIYNICENAIKYNVEGGSVSVWVGSTLNGPKVQVNDTGIGIPKEHQERIFERFYRVDKSHSKGAGRHRAGTLHREAWSAASQCKGKCGE